MSGSFWKWFHLGFRPNTLVMSLSDDELNILNNTQFLQLKYQLTEKVIAYFSSIERALHQEVQQVDFKFPEGTFLKSGKISKGEQYRLLPYFILDYPRLFTQKEIFAYRTMLWWGHHLSCTLQLSGPVLERNKESLIKNISLDKSAYFCVNDQPWDYHFESDNYLPVRELTIDEMNKHILQNGFVKISDYLPLKDWDQYKSFSLKTFARFLRYFY